MGRKGFPGKAGPEGVKVGNERFVYSHSFSIYRKMLINLCQTNQCKKKPQHLFQQGEPGITGNVGPMGERVRTADTAASIVPKCPSVQAYINVSLYFRAWLVSLDPWERQDWQEKRSNN